MDDVFLLSDFLLTPLDFFLATAIAEATSSCCFSSIAVAVAGCDLFNIPLPLPGGGDTVRKLLPFLAVDVGRGGGGLTVRKLLFFGRVPLGGGTWEGRVA